MELYLMKKLNLLYIVLLLALVMSACAPQAAATEANSPAAEAESAEAAPAAADADAPEACQADAYGCAEFAEGDVIKIGMGGPMLGDYSMFGIDISNGAKLAVEQNGEVEGRKMELVVMDTGGSAEAGAAVANKLVTDPAVVAIAGHIFSGETDAAMPIYEKAGIPMMSPSATNPPLTQQGSSVFNRTAFTDATQAKFAVDLLQNMLGAEKIAVMHDGSSYGQGLAELVRDYFVEAGGEVVATEAITPGEADYIAPLSAIAAAGPDAVYFGGYAAEGIVMANQWNQAGLQGVTFFGCDGTFGTEFLEKTGANGEGAYAVSLIPPDSAEKQAFDEAHMEAYGSEAGALSPYTWAAFDATNVLIDAVKNTAFVGENGNLYIPRGALVTAVRSTSGFEGLTGTMTCDEVGECNASGPTFYVVENGEWVPVAN
jgi:branched-chain amino acid transport system substrate-binding protein